VAARERAKPSPPVAGRFTSPESAEGPLVAVETVGAQGGRATLPHPLPGALHLCRGCASNQQENAGRREEGATLTSSGESFPFPSRSGADTCVGGGSLPSQTPPANRGVYDEGERGPPRAAGAPRPQGHHRPTYRVEACLNVDSPLLDRPLPEEETRRKGSGRGLNRQSLDANELRAF